MDAQKQRKQLIGIRKRDRVGGRVGSEPHSHFASPPVLCTLNDFIAHLPIAPKLSSQMYHRGGAIENNNK